MAISFDHRLCDKNPYCPAARACPSGALYVSGKTFAPEFDSEKCKGCGACTLSCSRGAVRES